MNLEEKCLSLLKKLQELKSNPDAVFDHESIRDSAGILGHKICKPYPPQWPYHHLIMSNGGVLPLSVELLFDLMTEHVKQNWADGEIGREIDEEGLKERLRGHGFQI